MRSFQRLKLDMEVGIDGMLVNEAKKISIYIKEISIIQFSCFLYPGTFYNNLLKSYSTKFNKKKELQIIIL